MVLGVLFVLGDFMAKLVKKKEVRLAAFDLYVTLDRKFKHVYGLRAIAAKVGVSLPTIIRWRDEDKWAERLDTALAKAREKASNSEEIKDLLTFHLFGTPPPEVAKTLDVVPVINKMHERKRMRLKKVIQHLSDIIVETRLYNHQAYLMLRGKFKDAIPAPFAKAELCDVHRAWLDSTKVLMDLFGVSTVKELAMEVVADEMMRQQIASTSPTPNLDPKMSVTVNMPGSGLQDSLTGNSPIVLDGSMHVTVMSIMMGEQKIDGPTGYTGPKKQGKIEGIEDAIVKPPNADDGGEE